MKRVLGIAFGLVTGGFGAIGSALVSTYRREQSPQLNVSTEPTSTSRVRRNGGTVAAAKRVAAKRRNVLRTRGHHRQAVR